MFNTLSLTMFPTAVLIVRKTEPKSQLCGKSPRFLWYYMNAIIFTWSSCNAHFLLLFRVKIWREKILERYTPAEANPTSLETDTLRGRVQVTPSHHVLQDKKYGLCALVQRCRGTCRPTQMAFAFFHRRNCLAYSLPVHVFRRQFHVPRDGRRRRYVRFGKENSYPLVCTVSTEVTIGSPLQILLYTNIPLCCLILVILVKLWR